MKGEPLSERERHVNELMEQVPHYWPDNAFDVSRWKRPGPQSNVGSRECCSSVSARRDEWGHGRRYDLYLDAARNSDRFLAELWRTLQQLPEYKDKTSLIVTCDHGRGSTRTDWTDHGEKVPPASGAASTRPIARWPGVGRHVPRPHSPRARVEDEAVGSTPAI